MGLFLSLHLRAGIPAGGTSETSDVGQTSLVLRPEERLDAVLAQRGNDLDEFPERAADGRVVGEVTLEQLEVVPPV